MNILYSIDNIKCHGEANGSITINSITLTESEIATYGASPVIDWTDNISPTNISDDTKYVNNLSGDIYGYRLYGNSTYSAFEYITLNDPVELQILKINKTNNPCLSTATVSVEVTGGAPPYSASFAQYLGNGSGTITITGISIDTSSFITVTDSNGCQKTSSSDLFINFSSTTFKLLSALPPKIYDDHPEEYKIEINGDGPFKIVIWESVNNTKTTITDQIEPYDTSNLISISGNYFTYNIADKIYPGEYILEIIDSNNCSFETGAITVTNILPLTANITIKNDNQIDITAYLLIEPILDSILIPYQLIKQDNNILEFIKNFNLNDRIQIKIGDQIYNQRIVKINKDKSNYFSNNIDILHCGPDQSEWFFNLYIAEGFNVNDTSGLFSENIVLIINNIEYTVVPEYNNDVSTIKLIRGSFLSKDINISQFKANKNVNIGTLSLPSYSLTKSASIIATQQLFLFNTYSIGSIFNSLFLENTIYNSVLDITASNSIDFSSESLQGMLDLKLTLQRINDFDDTLYIYTDNNLIHTGFIGIVANGGVVNNNNYNISYKYWNEEKLSLQDIYLNNNIVSDNSISDLKNGSYIIKLSDDNNNKLRTVNNILYNEHYSLALDYILNILNTTPENLNFTYGDILINIAKYENEIQNVTSPILGSDEEQATIETIDTQAEEIPVVQITNNETYNNYINVIMTNTVLCYLNGPNNYSYSFNKSTKFINLPPGVYNIVGDDTDLTNNFLEQISYIIYISNNSQQDIYLTFSSYLNKFIIGN